MAKGIGQWLSSQDQQLSPPSDAAEPETLTGNHRKATSLFKMEILGGILSLIQTQSRILLILPLPRDPAVLIYRIQNGPIAQLVRAADS
jgi:hypothetical protein